MEFALSSNKKVVILTKLHLHHINYSKLIIFPVATYNSSLKSIVVNRLLSHSPVRESIFPILLGIFAICIELSPLFGKKCVYI